MARLFIAIDLPSEIISAIISIQNHIYTSKLINANLIKPEQLHLTLKFLGNVNEDLIERIEESLNNIQLNSFEVNLSSIGVFSQDFIRVIWVGLESIELYILKEKIDQALIWLTKSSIKDKEFKAHVTIARVKSVANKDQLTKLISEIKVPKLKFVINSFVLKKSILLNQGSKYFDVRKFYLISG